MGSSQKLTIMAVALNEARHVGTLQASVNRLQRPAGCEIETVLVDGGSKDGTAEAALAAGFTKVIVLPGANIPVCRNRAMQESSGDWLAWVGRYEDLARGGAGEYRVRLQDNQDGNDCGYAGLELLPDGTFVATTYGHWVAGEPPFVIAQRFTLAELDALAGER